MYPSKDTKKMAIRGRVLNTTHDVEPVPVAESVHLYKASKVSWTIRD